MNVNTANKLAKLREGLKLSQEELAEKINVSRQTVSKWERAEASPDMENLLSLSRLYNIDIDYMLGINIEVEEHETDTPHSKVNKEMKKRQDAWAAIGIMVAIIVFLVTGLMYGMWYINWVVFLIIPIFYYIPMLGVKK